LYGKNPRTVEPRGGKIDFDIDGVLSGNWFLEGTPVTWEASSHTYSANQPAFVYYMDDPHGHPHHVWRDVEFGPVRLSRGREYPRSEYSHPGIGFGHVRVRPGDTGYAAGGNDGYTDDSGGSVSG